MSGSFVFVVPGLRRDHLMLQPWRYIYELAVRFSAHRPVVIVTDTEGVERTENWSPELKVSFTGKLSPRNRTDLATFLDGFEPEHVWWSTTPRSFVYQSVWKRLRCPITAMVTCPLYPWNLLIRAWTHGVPLKEMRALINQRFIPRWLFVKMLSSSMVFRVVTQSQSNRNILIEEGVPERKIKVIPVGDDNRGFENINTDKILAAKKMLGFPPEAKIFIYLGAMQRIRGIYALLDAFSLVIRRNQDAYLGILARGADEKLCETMRAYCMKKEIVERVKFIGGWLTREQVHASIEGSDVVTLPFIIVPSDVPVAILEALSRGKPVISSNVDGIPELISGRGIVVDPLDKNALAQAMLKFLESETFLKEMGEAALSFMANYPDWDRIGEMALKMGN